jgi:hypothetical protein
VPTTTRYGLRLERLSAHGYPGCWVMRMRTSPAAVDGVLRGDCVETCYSPEVGRRGLRIRNMLESRRHSGTGACELGAESAVVLKV